MFGLFGGKDVNVLAVIFERRDVYQVSAQRVTAGNEKKAQEGARSHARCLCWAVFDQKGKLKTQGEGAGSLQVTGEVLKRLQNDLPTNKTVQEVLKGLQIRQGTRLGKPLVWNGYPPRQMHGSETRDTDMDK